MAETCLVTGAGGFVGTALCRRLLAEGYAVRGLDVPFGGDVLEGLQRLDGDICDAALLEEGCAADSEEYAALGESRPV